MTAKNERTAVMLEPELLERERLRGMLRRTGFARVLAAADGAELLQLLAGELVHLVLIPWEAPDFSGLEMLRTLRKRGKTRNVPVVILDHGLPQQSVVAAIKAGAAGRLKKPGRAEQLKKILTNTAASAEGKRP